MEKVALPDDAVPPTRRVACIPQDSMGRNRIWIWDGLAPQRGGQTAYAIGDLVTRY
jgi:hypothetical protein